MANSRANIYPVQLQGAELNLNKYDAEIKQYSGFNKNNVPFVGGCLSNIFTKDETIEGATSKNTYIAPNGDVYRVNTEGLWKNNKKVIDTNNADCYEREEVNFPDNVFYIYDEFCYITIDNLTGAFDLHYFSFRDEEWKTVNLITVNVLYIYSNSFSIKRFRNSSRDEICIAIKTATISYIRIKAKIIGEYKNRNDVFTYDSNNFVDILRYSFDDINEVILKMPQPNSIYIFDNEGYGYYRIDFIVTPTEIQIYDGPTLEPDISSGYNLFNGGVNFATYYLVSENLLHLKYFPASDSGYSSTFCATVGYDSNARLNYNYLQEYFDAYPDTIRGSFRTSRRVKNYGMCYADIIDAYNGYENVKKAYAICDFVTMTATMENNKAHFYTGAVVDKRVLFNNEVVTGLCTPSGEVLLTEWNSVDENHIYFKSRDNGATYINDFEIIYKDTQGKFWKIKKTVPQLKVINNQIIINADSKFNACNLDTNEIMKFALAYNNRIKMPYYGGAIYAYPTDAENHYYIAASINEYAQENNASIILNPLPVFCVAWMEQIAGGRTSDYNDYKYFVNLYWGNTASEVEYRISLYNNYIRTCIVLDKLKGLPFPYNTDGNIQYSPSLFATQKGKYGNFVLISEGGTAYKLMTYDNKAIMSYFLSNAVEGLQDFFTIQGQLYGILDNQIYNFSIVNEVVNRGDFIVSVEGLQFCGNTPYEALFFSKTNRCLYSFTGSNVLNVKQFVDKISEVRNYKYNPATQSIFLITDIGVIAYSLFGIYQIEFLNCQDMYLLNNGVVLTDNEGTFKYVKYYKEETTDDYTKENIQLETMFYGMNNQTVTINDCLYFRIFSEEHESGVLEVSATTLANRGRTTERTTFKIKASDWDAETHSIYLRYQPKEQRGLGISFKINSPFKIAALSVGSIPDAVLIDKVSKGAINAPNISSNNIDW